MSKGVELLLKKCYLKKYIKNIYTQWIITAMLSKQQSESSVILIWM